MNKERSERENKEKFNKAMHKIVEVLDKYVFSFFFHKYSYFHSLALPAPHITLTHTNKWNYKFNL